MVRVSATTYCGLFSSALFFFSLPWDAVPRESPGCSAPLGRSPGCSASPGFPWGQDLSTPVLCSKQEPELLVL